MAPEDNTDRARLQPRTHEDVATASKNYTARVVFFCITAFSQTGGLPGV